MLGPPSLHSLAPRLLGKSSRHSQQSSTLSIAPRWKRARREYVLSVYLHWPLPYVRKEYVADLYAIIGTLHDGLDLCRSTAPHLQITMESQVTYSTQLNHLHCIQTLLCLHVSEGYNTASRYSILPSIG